MSKPFLVQRTKENRLKRNARSTRAVLKEEAEFQNIDQQLAALIPAQYDQWFRFYFTYRPPEIPKVEVVKALGFREVDFKDPYPPPDNPFYFSGPRPPSTYPPSAYRDDTYFGPDGNAPAPPPPPPHEGGGGGPGDAGGGDQPPPPPDGSHYSGDTRVTYPSTAEDDGTATTAGGGSSGNDGQEPPPPPVPPRQDMNPEMVLGGVQQINPPYEQAGGPALFELQRRHEEETRQRNEERAREQQRLQEEQETTQDLRAQLDVAQTRLADTVALLRDLQQAQLDEAGQEQRADREARAAQNETLRATYEQLEYDLRETIRELQNELGQMRAAPPPPPPAPAAAPEEDNRARIEEALDQQMRGIVADDMEVVEEVRREMREELGPALARHMYELQDLEESERRLYYRARRLSLRVEELERQLRDSPPQTDTAPLENEIRLLRQDLERAQNQVTAKEGQKIQLERVAASRIHEKEAALDANQRLREDVRRLEEVVRRQEQQASRVHPASQAELDEARRQLEAANRQAAQAYLQDLDTRRHNTALTRELERLRAEMHHADVLRAHMQFQFEEQLQSAQEAEQRSRASSTGTQGQLENERTKARMLQDILENQLREIEQLRAVREALQVHYDEAYQEAEMFKQAHAKMAGEHAEELAKASDAHDLQIAREKERSATEIRRMREELEKQTARVAELDVAAAVATARRNQNEDLRARLRQALRAAPPPAEDDMEDEEAAADPFLPGMPMPINNPINNPVYDEQRDEEERPAVMGTSRRRRSDRPRGFDREITVMSLPRRGRGGGVTKRRAKKSDRPRGFNREIIVKSLPQRRRRPDGRG